MARPIKLPPRAEIVRRLTGQRDLLRAKGNEAGASAIQRMIDAPITREWPEHGGTIPDADGKLGKLVPNPAEKTPKGCGHTGNPGDVCSDCSFTPHLAPRLLPGTRVAYMPDEHAAEEEQELRGMLGTVTKRRFIADGVAYGPVGSLWIGVAWDDTSIHSQECEADYLVRAD